MSTKSLKETYAWHLRGFVALNALVFVALFASDDILAAIRLGELGGLVSPKAVLGLVLPLVTLILDGIVSADTKAFLVYWRRKDPLPGSRAFTKHGPADARVDLVAIAEQHGALPTAAAEQNLLWYKLSKSVADRASVAEAHRSSLLTRDLTNLSFALTLIGAIAGAVLRIGVLPWVVLVAALVLQFVVLSLVAANKGRRFVTTVLAEASVDTD